MKFLFEYLKDMKTVGAVAPSSKNLAKKMTEPIDFSNCNCIIEYGAGTGVFTRELIEKKNKETKLLVIEQNKNFYNMLQEKFGKHDGVYIIHGEAQRAEEYLKKHQIPSAEYIVSGLPFASLPQNISKEILTTTSRILGENGKFITFQYTLLKKKFFQEWFHLENIKLVLLNLPSAFVFTMKPKVF